MLLLTSESLFPVPGEGERKEGLQIGMQEKIVQNLHHLLHSYKTFTTIYIVHAIDYYHAA